jgi:hypothetical protein
MEFEEQYLSYEDYKGLGGTLDLMPFNLLEFESRRLVDIRTFNRLKGKKDIPQEVKLCEYALINSINEFAKNNTKGNIASENTDGYSVSYAQISEVVKSKNAELIDIIRTYLLGVIYDNEHLMYVGV